MKHAISAAVALALGIGLAATAQAHGTYDRQSAIPGTDMQAGTSAPVRHVAQNRQMQSRQQVIKTQRMLRAQGLYNGRITGIMDRRTRTALGRFEQQNGKQRVAQLSRKQNVKFARLHRTTKMAGLHKRAKQNIAVGSSTPKPNTQNQTMSGSSSSPTQTQTMPPTNQTPSAGGNTTDQNMNR